jgi:membrane glycosyltransferase
MTNPFDPRSSSGIPCGGSRSSLLVTLTTLVALGLLVSVFHTNGISPMELLLLLLYTILFSWICISFWTAFMGFFVILFGRDRWAISRQPRRAARSPPPRRRTPRF